MTKKFDDIVRRAKEEWRALHAADVPLILVGTATCGRGAGAMETLEALKEKTAADGVECNIMEVGCIGLCYAEPLVTITKPGRPAIVYGEVTAERASELVDKYIVNDDPLPEYAMGTIGEGQVAGIPNLFDTSVLKSQVRRVLKNCGTIDPTNINHYIANGGYSGIARALEMGPEKVLDEVKASGLRGRGGAGFPTWRKWQFARDAAGEKKYIVCNGSEGDPGAFSNRLLFESDPHSVIEGMLVAGLAVGADEGYVYCAAEFPLAYKRLVTVVEQMKGLGLEGDGILGSSYNFHIKVKAGAGAYVCGEETALIEGIEGKRGNPRFRPPFPPVEGLWGRPTVVNNVETLACVTFILQKGASRFAEVGTEKSKGTKVFCLSGNAARAGAVEMPMGATLREIVIDTGGGTADGKNIKAVHAGGPGGGVLPTNLIDAPVDLDSLQGLGASLGSGGITVLDEDVGMVDVAYDIMDFAVRECCGKCVPGRLGTMQIRETLKDIAVGAGRAGDIELLQGVAEAMKKSALCGLGQAILNPMLSTIRYFRGEYEANLKAGPARKTVEKTTDGAR